MQLFKAVWLLVTFGALPAQPAAAQTSWGPQASEGEPDGRQQRLLRSPDPATAAHAILFRPPGEGPFRLAVVVHATSQNVLRRAQMPQPEYRALVGWLVARGFAVRVPERPGHGATGQSPHPASHNAVEKRRRFISSLNICTCLGLSSFSALGPASHFSC